MAQLVKNLPAMRETWVLSLGLEAPLEKGKATHSSVLAWRVPWAVRSQTRARLSDFHCQCLEHHPGCRGGCRNPGEPLGQCKRALGLRPGLEKWTDSGSIQKAEPTAFPNRTEWMVRCTSALGMPWESGAWLIWSVVLLHPEKRTQRAELVCGCGWMGSPALDSAREGKLFLTLWGAPAGPKLKLTETD